MTKVVVIKLDERRMNQVSHESDHFHVTLQIAREGQFPELEKSGSLPQNPELYRQCQQWESIYLCCPNVESRAITARRITNNQSYKQWCDDCYYAAKKLRDRLNQWLRSESFLPLRESWRANIKDTLALNDVTNFVFIVQVFILELVADCFEVLHLGT